MEYPGSKFNRPIRLSLLILFIVLFFSISPTVILYSAGYRYDFKNGLLKETGSLSVDVLPKGANVYLDGLNIDQSMPIRLNNLTPHKYTLRISYPGYYDWEKQIEILKNQTTYIKEMILLKKDKAVQISKDSAQQLSVSNLGEHLAYAVVERADTKIYVKRLPDGAAYPILTVATTSPLLLQWAPLSDYLVVSSAGAPYDVLSVFNPDAPKSAANLAALESNPILKYVWSKNSEPEIYYGTAQGISSYLVRLKQTRVITKPDYLDWYLDDGALWTLKLNTTTRQILINEDALGFNTLYSTVQSPPNATSSTLDTSIMRVYGGTILMKNNLTGEFTLARPSNSYTVNASRYLVSPFSDWWLMWSPYELWTYAAGSEPSLLSRSGEELLDVQPIDRFNTLALEWKDHVSVLYPYFYTERTLVSSAVKAMSADPTRRILYYSNESGLWRINY